MAAPEHFQRPALIALVALSLLLVPRFAVKLSGAISFAGQASGVQRAPKGRPGMFAASPEIPAPFQVGEILDYHIGWSSFANAASLELSVTERRNLYGWQTWHFRAALHTVRPVRRLFEIDDQFDSYTDISTSASRQFEIYRNELGTRETQISHLVSKGAKSPVPGAAVVVLPGTQDPLGMIFALRGVDWERRPYLSLPVYDGHDIYEMRAHTDGVPEKINVDAGSFTASRIVIEAFQREEKDSTVQVAVWIANNRERTPVLIAAKLGFGDVRAELVSVKSATSVKQ